MVPSYLGILALAITGRNFLRDISERRTAQANKVAAWVQKSNTDNEPHRLVIKNANDLPCTNLCVWWTEGSRNPKKLRTSKTFGGDTDWVRKPRYIHAIGPGETVVAHSTHEELAVRTLEFRDAAGRLWVRRGSQLTELSRPSLRGRIDVFRRNLQAKKRLRSLQQDADVVATEVSEAPTNDPSSRTV